MEREEWKVQNGKKTHRQHEMNNGASSRVSDNSHAMKLRYVLEEELLSFERKYGVHFDVFTPLMLSVKSRKMKAGCLTPTLRTSLCKVHNYSSPFYRLFWERAI